MSDGRLIACVGVDNLVVIETADAILVAHKDKTQDVKKIVDRLKAAGRTEGHPSSTPTDVSPRFI